MGQAGMAVHGWHRNGLWACLNTLAVLGSRRGLLARDAENAYLDLAAENEAPMDTIMGHSITYRIAAGPNAGRKVFTLQTPPASQEPTNYRVANLDGFSLHAV